MKIWLLMWLSDLAGTLFWGLRVSLGFCSRTFTQCSDRQLFCQYKEELFYEVCTKTPESNSLRSDFMGLLKPDSDSAAQIPFLFCYLFVTTYSLSTLDESQAFKFFRRSSDRTDMIPFCFYCQHISSGFTSPSVFIGFNFIIFPLMCLSTWLWVGTCLRSFVCTAVLWLNTSSRWRIEDHKT